MMFSIASKTGEIRDYLVLMGFLAYSFIVTTGLIVAIHRSTIGLLGHGRLPTDDAIYP